MERIGRRRRLRTALPVVLPLAAAFLAGPGAPAQVPGSGGEPFTPHREAQDAISRLRSPYCPGLMLEVCPSPQAAVLRDSIQMLAAEGWPADSLVEWMLANHGEEWRALPRREGAGLWAWIVPPAALLLGLAAVIVALRRLRRRRKEGADEPRRAGISPADQERLQEALREMEESEEPLL